MTEIADCPWCETNDFVRCEALLNVRYVVCLGCGASGPQKDTPEAAVEAWERVARLQEKLEALQNEQDYDPGLINDYGGGNVDWWQDYIRYEVNRCNEYWRSLIE